MTNTGSTINYYYYFCCRRAPSRNLSPPFSVLQLCVSLNADSTSAACFFTNAGAEEHRLPISLSSRTAKFHLSLPLPPPNLQRLLLSGCRSWKQQAVSAS